ncbi:MAG: hypothetical protein HY674_14200 [Chloroflexi bacterium]|nr:hypothetical protein [Chloroflexota bacterium]
MLAALWVVGFTAAELQADDGEVKTPPAAIVLVEPETVATAAVAQWKKEGFKAAAVVLDERTSQATCHELARRTAESGLDLYWWIEVARNPKMAAAHPLWMAALGSHQDWQKNFPKFPEPGTGEVAKAFPWVPLGYAEAFDAHLARIDQLLQQVPAGYRGLLLNDLQGGPSSCGCGNLLCRWALDYQVATTAKNLEGNDAAARFIAEIHRRVGEKTVIPVWTTECTDADLPAEKHQGRPGTGLCGTVGCATGACPNAFTHQFDALASSHNGPIGLLALHTALRRTQKEFGGGPGWVTNALDYLSQTLSANGGKAVAPQRLWAIIEGLAPDAEATARELAVKAGVGAVIVARAPIEQSYEPRMVRLK